MINTNVVFVAAAIAALSLSACATAPDTAQDEADVTATLDTFYGAMKSGDSAKAMSMIAQDAQFVETGRLETRDEYEKNHLPLDIDFEKQVSGKRGPLRIRINGDTAWVIASTEFVGTFDGRDLAMVSRQLAVLTREEAGWRIQSIHWSSMPL
jgi:ketosteroid isomerase-like protein